MLKSAHDEAKLRLIDLPLLTTRRACIVADCTRWTLQRSGPGPVGRRGRTFVYRTADILAWLASGIDVTAPARTHKPMRSSLPSQAALDRLRSVARGGGK
jgi:hypothetical protein